MSYLDEAMVGDVAQETTGVNYDMETDISQLEAPTFTTIGKSWKQPYGENWKINMFVLADRGAPQAMLQLQWDHTVNLVGKKVRTFYITYYD